MEDSSSRLIKLLIRLTLVFSVPVLCSLITYIVVRSVFFSAKDPDNHEEKLIVIEEGKSFKDASKSMEEAGVIKRSWAMEILARLKKSDTQINAGEYMLSPAMTPEDILKKLLSGEVVKRVVTVKEGMSIWEIGERIEEAKLMDGREFSRELVSTALLTQAGILAPSFEGYLFPETYYFSKPVTARKIIFTMIEQGEKRWPQEYNEQAFKLGLSRHEILTLASIIEKESGDVNEMPLVSSVFHNRLKKGMKLQSDPTVIYGIPEFDGNLTKIDLQTPTPYNTYTNFGLPPGPICNPGEQAIKAALFPADTTYLFFVANGHGQHVFSNTLKEHNEAVREYQLRGGRVAEIQEEVPPAEDPAAEEQAQKKNGKKK